MAHLCAFCKGGECEANRHSRVPHFSRPVREVGLFASTLFRYPNTRGSVALQRHDKVRENSRLQPPWRDVQQPEEWPWGSYPSYASSEEGAVKLIQQPEIKIKTLSRGSMSATSTKGRKGVLPVMPSVPAQKSRGPEMLCVYTTPTGLCDGTAPLSANEHYLPRALGNFQGDERLVNRICNSCQQVCSKLEDVFAHNSPEAFFREMVGRVGRKNHNGKNIFYEPTFGIPPLAVLGKHPGHDFEILWELVPDPENPGDRKCTPMSQLVFISDDSKTLRLPFRPGRWTVERIKDILKKSGVKGDHIVTVGSSEEEDAEMKALTDVLAPAGKEREVAPLVHGADIEGEMKAETSEKYVRAIAKVGFHYFLKYFPNFSGMEPEFDEIKNFIYHGKSDREIARIVGEPFLRDLQQRGARLNRWCHLLSAESTDRGIEARIQFFAGPEVQPLVWSIVISTKPSSHVQYTGHAFVYFDDVTEEYQGQRMELIVAPISLEDDIRLRAYSLYVQRGRRNGLALDDWLEAEAEILRLLRQRPAP